MWLLGVGVATSISLSAWTMQEVIALKVQVGSLPKEFPPPWFQKQNEKDMEAMKARLAVLDAKLDRNMEILTKVESKISRGR
jgi:hypothetical protein